MIDRTDRVIRMGVFGAACLMLTGFHWWDPIARWIGIGNEAYRQGQYEEAGGAYQKALEADPDSAVAALNRGTAQYQARKIDDAARSFEQAAKADVADVKARALYNSGCAQLGKGDAAQAAESFRKALMANPHDEDAKANLEIARKMMDEQQQTPQPQQGSPNPQEDQTPSPEASPSPQESQSSEEQTPQPGESPQAEQTPQTEASPQPQQAGQPATPTPLPGAMTQPTPTPGDQTPAAQPQPAGTAEPPEDGKMDKVEAERLLDLMETEELEVLKRFHQLPEVDERNVEKDW